MDDTKRANTADDLDEMDRLLGSPAAGKERNAPRTQKPTPARTKPIVSWRNKRRETVPDQQRKPTAPVSSRRRRERDDDEYTVVEETTVHTNTVYDGEDDSFGVFAFLCFIVFLILACVFYAQKRAWASAFVVLSVISLIIAISGRRLFW